MENSETYRILKVLIEQRRLVIRHGELSRLLAKLQRQGRVTQGERRALLDVAEHLKIYDLPLAE